MTDEQRRAYAEELIKDMTRDPDFMGIFEMAEDSPHVPGGEISEHDARVVLDWMRSAIVTVTWPEAPR